MQKKKKWTDGQPASTFSLQRRLQSLRCWGFFPEYNRFSHLAILPVDHRFFGGTLGPVGDSRRIPNTRRFQSVVAFSGFRVGVNCVFVVLGLVVATVTTGVPEIILAGSPMWDSASHQRESPTRELHPHAATAEMDLSLHERRWSEFRTRNPVDHGSGVDAVGCGCWNLGGESLAASSRSGGRQFWQNLSALVGVGVDRTKAATRTTVLQPRSKGLVTLVVLAGSGEILAHRDQLRPYRAREEARTNILIPTASGANMNLEQPATLRASGSADEDGDFRGYSNAELARARKRKVDAAQLPEVPEGVEGRGAIRIRRFSAGSHLEPVASLTPPFLCSIVTRRLPLGYSEERAESESKACIVCTIYSKMPKTGKIEVVACCDAGSRGTKIRCEFCAKSWHTKCANITANAIKTLRDTGGACWLCPTCRTPDGRQPASSDTSKLILQRVTSALLLIGNLTDTMRVFCRMYSASLSASTPSTTVLPPTAALEPDLSDAFHANLSDLFDSILGAADASPSATLETAVTTTPSAVNLLAVADPATSPLAAAVAAVTGVANADASADTLLGSSELAASLPISPHQSSTSATAAAVAAMPPTIQPEEPPLTMLSVQPLVTPQPPPPQIMPSLQPQQVANIPQVLQPLQIMPQAPPQPLTMPSSQPLVMLSPTMLSAQPLVTPQPPLPPPRKLAPPPPLIMQPLQTAPPASTAASTNEFALEPRFAQTAPGADVKHNKPRSTPEMAVMACRQSV
ncbi:hypothetical protein CpipJ_CPIJ002190 [Culex quinquefasciatus]|uniref:PHD-type domain-containing protein n=1 Tax=Culex quinquefasciatus TaxID=7176 RepID=B0W575_CULQU|nr:hypothetical protein CpipJ_CPIJ002190 [Culex quinquefasciatus]|eukprot:XP_001843859.1 hypothetical protein CpipJ_CPIJ002190 [Culex quinquefasciatus]